MLQLIRLKLINNNLNTKLLFVSNTRLYTNQPEQQNVIQNEDGKFFFSL